MFQSIRSLRIPHQLKFYHERSSFVYKILQALASSHIVREISKLWLI